MKKKSLIFLLLATLLTGCGTEKKGIEEEKLTVVTSFYPVYLLAQEVTAGAEGMQLLNMAQPQTGCLHDYEMTISDMKLLEQADVLIINGGGMESFLHQALERYPQMQVIDTSEGIHLLEEESHHHHEEETAEEHAAHEHEQEGNPHIWLSPDCAAKQAEQICKALTALEPADEAVFAANTAAFQAELEQLKAEAAALQIPAGEFAAVFHEGFGYVTEWFGMETVYGIFADEYQEPSAKELMEAAEEGKRHGIRFFLTAEDNGEKYAAVLAGENGEAFVLLDPLTTAVEEQDSYMERMRKNIEMIGNHWKEVQK